MDRRKAFTLVELLVVIAIIGVLVALLLPAVQAAREAARRSQCTNNLKQIGLALHNYHDTYQTFPSGYMHFGTGATNWGWGAFILPFMENRQLYDSLGVNERTLGQCFGDTTLTALLQMPVAGFRCPSDTMGETNEIRKFNSDNTALSVSNYLGAIGMEYARNDEPSGGVFHGNSRVRMADITDGTSNTICVGERDGGDANGVGMAAGVWAGVRNSSDQWQGGVRMLLGGFSEPMNLHNTNESMVNNGMNAKGFGSLHPGGANFLFADGSVHFLAETVDFNSGGFDWATGDYTVNSLGLYQLLGVRNDGRPVAFP